MVHLSSFDGPQRAAVRLLAWLLLWGPLAAAQPVLVKDLVPTGIEPFTGPQSFRPSYLASMGGVVYFSAFDPRYGPELWRSDGTTAGTVLLKDIIAGAIGAGPADLTAVNNTLYFTADDGRSGRELWKSDGTAEGTVRVRDIGPGAVGSSPSRLAAVGSTLYFTADDGASGYELWKSNGTAAGTVRVKDIVPGAANGSPQALTAMNGTLYFVAEDANGLELWKSNGTAAGTVMVKDIRPGPAGAFGYGANLYAPPALTAVNGTLYFGANDGTHGFELWKSNGTAAGTTLVLDIASGSLGDDTPYSSLPQDLVNVNGTLYFAASDDYLGRELWKSDGTADGTVMVKDIEEGFETYIELFVSSDPGELTNVNGTLYFAAASGYEGRELWKSDGTLDGTVMVKDLRPGTKSVPHPSRPGFGWTEPLHSNPTDLTNVNGVLYCLSNTGFWKSDGTEAGTVLLKPLEEAGHLVASGSTAFVAGRLGAGAVELWKSNGTAAGTVPVRGAGTGIPAGGRPQQTFNLNGTLYFAAGNAASGYSLWKSTGTSAGTTLVKKIGPDLRGLTNAGGKLYFIGDDGTHGPELWKSDGTAAGTVMVKDVAAAGQSVKYLRALNGVVYFVADPGGIGEELFKSDGTAAGTVLVKDIYPGGEYVMDYDKWEEIYYPHHGNPADLTVVNGVLYFRADSPAGKGELWRSNGTAAGTVLVKDIHPGQDPEYVPNGADIRYLTGLNGTLYFSANDGSGGHTLWKSNGTAAGTVEVKDAPVRQITKAGNTLFFWSSRGWDPVELWKSDGTPAGTSLVKSIPTGLFDPFPQFLASVGNVLYFTTEHTSYGRELWRSDGTGTGTYLLRNITPGASATTFGTAAVLGSELYFAAGPTAETLSLWKSNGTTTGTVAVSSLPAYSLAAMSGVLYFTSNDGRTGYELWKYNPATCISPSTATAVQGSSVCLNNNATVTVKAAQTGVRYQLYAGASALGLSQVGNGGDLTFTVPAASLLTGTYPFSVKAEGCREVTLTQTATVTVTAPLATPTANGTTISSGQTAALTASGAPAGATYRWYAAAAGGTPLASTATYTTPALTATTSYYVAAHQLPCGESARRTVTVTVSGGALPTFRVNAGGNAFSTIDARGFAADAYASGGAVSTATTLGIGGTADDYLYQTGRHGSSFSYNFPTGNGSYDVVLHFAETYFGNAAPGGIGSRKFHVNMEGQRKLTDYDVYAKAGGALRATQETFRVTVADGTLNVSFLRGTADNPAVKAIEVLPAGSALAINSGGGAFTTGSGKRFAADVYYASGTVSALTSGDILNTTNDGLYRDARVGVFSYGLPSGNGTFDVTLHFAETYFGSRAAGGVGSRKFDVYVENVKRLAEYDVFAKAGGAMRAVRETVRVTVTDGILNLFFAKGSADNPVLSALEVVAVPVAARVAAAEGEAGNGTAKLFPNPVQDKLFVALPFPAGQVRGTAVTDARGTVLLLNTHRVSGENQLEIGTGTLPKGLFLLRVESEDGGQTLKFLKR